MLLSHRRRHMAGSRRLAPSRQMLRGQAVSPRHLAHHRARRKGFRNDLSLDLVAPTAPPDPASWL